MSRYRTQAEADINAEIDAKNDRIVVLKIIRTQIEIMGLQFERVVIAHQLPPALRLKLLDLWTDFTDQAVTDQIAPEIRCLRGEIEDLEPSLPKDHTGAGYRS